MAGRCPQQALTLAVFGTPTLIDEDTAGYLKLTAEPSAERVREVFDAVTTLICDTPGVSEIRRTT